MAAKSGDMDYCQTHFRDFAKQMAILNEQLADVFIDENETANILPKESAEFLLKNLQTALAAANDLDTDTGLETLTALLQFDFSGIMENQIKTR